MQTKTIVMMLALVFLSGCMVDGYISGSVPLYRSASPAHGAYGHRQAHRYYYYPEAEIYFDVDRNMYFYLDSAGQWQMNVRLPLHLRPHLRHRYVEIESDDDRPYRQHKRYRKKYHHKYFDEKRHERSRHFRDENNTRHEWREKKRHDYKERREERKEKYKKHKKRDKHDEDD